MNDALGVPLTHEAFSIYFVGGSASRKVSHVRTGQTRNRCIGDQDRVPDSARVSDAQFRPSWNVAPTDNLPIVRYDAKAGSRTLDLMRWGLVPY